MPLLWKMINLSWNLWCINPWSITWFVLWMMTLNAFTLKVDKSIMKENVIHKPLINHVICTLNDDTECLYSESIVVKGMPRLGAAWRHPPVPRLKGGDTPSRRRRLGVQGGLLNHLRPGTHCFSFSFSFFFFYLFFFFFRRVAEP